MISKKIQQNLKPLNSTALQCYLGTGIHTLGLLGWILEQTGRADVYVSTFSTSEEFLNGFLNLRKKGLIRYAVMVADLKASKKTVKLNQLMSYCFDAAYLGMNHSKIVLVQTDAGQTISVASSQNNTYGGRAECTIISTSQEIFLSLYEGLKKIIDNSCELNGIYKRAIENDRKVSTSADSGDSDWLPFGY